MREKRLRLSASFAALLLLSAAIPAQSAPIENGGFENKGPQNSPQGWSVPMAGAKATVTEENPFEGKRCVLLERNPDNKTAAFGNMMQGIDAANFRGKRVRFTAQVRVEGKDKADRAAMWMRVDRPDARPGFFDNMGNRPIRDPKWKPYVIAGNVDDDAMGIALGVMIFGNARAWVDAVTFEVVGDAVVTDQPPRSLTDRGLANLVALTRLIGYVRFFHPSDESQDLDWDSFAIAAVDDVEGAASAEALAAALRGTFESIAPGVQIWAGSTSGGPPEAKLPDATTARDVLSYEHRGVGLAPKSIYASERVVRSRSDTAGSESRPAPGASRVKELGGGVCCRVPIVLLRDGKGTLPHAAKRGPPAAPSRPEGWVPSGKDRATRVAAVMLAWTVFQHFYPYFDVVKTDWSGALPAALRRSATDPDPRAFLDTLRELVAKLHDGHGGVYQASGLDRSALALDFAWAGADLVVERVIGNDGDAARGDVVLAIDGKPLAEHVARESRLISAATDGWRRYRLLTALQVMATADPCSLKVRSPSGAERVVKAPRIAPRAPKRPEGAPKNGAEIAPGVVYFDMNGASQENLEPLLPVLARARGIVFDMRGYPGSGGTEIIRHLTKETITSAQWRIPHVLLPDQEGFDCPSIPGWVLTPKTPHFDAKVAFVTDGRAISYAESCMGIVENYRLGAIVGEPTAGTNGNVNPFVLPGAYSVSWTGMRVLKHDGSQHHGVGILPTVPCSRTVGGIAAGRDELLEKAIETVRP